MQRSTPLPEPTIETFDPLKAIGADDPDGERLLAVLISCSRGS
jgi:hypothetical protein